MSRARLHTCTTMKPGPKHIPKASRFEAPSCTRMGSRASHSKSKCKHQKGACCHKLLLAQRSAVRHSNAGQADKTAAHRPQLVNHSPSKKQKQAQQDNAQSTTLSQPAQSINNAQNCKSGQANFRADEKPWPTTATPRLLVVPC